MENIRVLLVKDDPSLRMVVSETLEIEGFYCEVAADGAIGLQKFINSEYDVIIADIMMPNLDGMEMVTRIRQRNHHIPILFLTAKSSVDNVVEGFKAGADDYLRKPFSMRELIVRINALYLRANHRQPEIIRTQNNTNIITLGSYTFDPVSQYLHHGGNTEKLSARESEILNILAYNVNEVVAASHIMKTLWEDDSYYVTNSLQVFITRLRNRLRHDSAVRIVNARGIGYKLVIDFP